MTPWDVSSRLSFAVALIVLVGCYDPPRPACGFRCGPAAACPADYTCGADNHCRLAGSPPDLQCALPDAASFPDAYSPNARLVIPFEGTALNPIDAVVVAFDVDVINVSGLTFLVTPTGSSLLVAGTVTYNPASRTAQFFRSQGLPPNEQLTATLTADIVDPASGRPLMPTSFTFFTGPDTTRPTVLATDPPMASTGIGVDTAVVIQLSEPVFTVDASTFTLFETVTTTPVTGAVAYDTLTSTATLDPQDQLAPNLEYTARLDGSITDPSGNAISPAPFLTTFTTGADTVAPGVRTTSPADLDVDVAVDTNITVTFDEPVANVDTTSFQVNAGAITGTVTMSNGDRTATFDPDADLPGGATITVTLGAAITDAAANALAPVTFSFATI